MTIGVMDSGIGGLNVLAALMKYRCANRYLYLADDKNLPYGEKSGEELKEIALSGAKRLIERGANVIVFGCNTLSVTALDHVRKRVIPPVFGLHPRPELLAGKALMLTTPTTALYLPRIEENVRLLTPADLARLVDENYPDLSSAERYISPLIAPYDDTESVYLGCSHYLYVGSLIQRLLPKAKIQDGTEALAALIAAVLPANGCKDPSVQFFFSQRDQSERYYEILRSLLK